jgi:hypothetical protein
MVRLALVLGLRCTSSSMRNKWTALVGKLLTRIRLSVHSVLQHRRMRSQDRGYGRRTKGCPGDASDDGWELEGEDGQTDTHPRAKRKKAKLPYPSKAMLRSGLGVSLEKEVLFHAAAGLFSDQEERSKVFLS